MTLRTWLQERNISLDTVRGFNLGTTGTNPKRDAIFCIRTVALSELTGASEIFIKYPMFTPEVSAISHITGISESEYLANVDYLDSALITLGSKIHTCVLGLTYAKRTFFQPSLETSSITLLSHIPMLDIGILFSLLDMNIPVFSRVSSVSGLVSFTEETFRGLDKSTIERTPPLSALCARYGIQNSGSAIRDRTSQLFLLGQILLDYNS